MKGWEFAAWMTLFGVLVIGSVIGNRKRAKSMTSLANRLGLHTWGDRLPPELTLVGTAIAGASATWNVVEGKQNGVPVIAFDCRIGTGKSSWRRTVIAARSSRNVFATMFSDSSYVVDRAGDWFVLYAPRNGFSVWRSLMPISELEARLSALREE